MERGAPGWLLFPQKAPALLRGLAADVESLIVLLAREMYANEGIHMAEDDKAAWDDDALLTVVYDEYLNRARAALSPFPPTPEQENASE